MNRYTLGQKIRLSLVVKDLTGALVDAATAIIKTQPKGGVITTNTPDHDGTGLYHYDYEPAESDLHGIRAETTNPDGAAESQVFIDVSVLH